MAYQLPANPLSILAMIAGGIMYGIQEPGGL